MMAQDPSDISRTAFHRLVGAIIALVESRDSRAMLFEQVRAMPQHLRDSPTLCSLVIYPFLSLLRLYLPKIHSNKFD